MRFEGKSVVVTGASSGMGYDIAKQFAAEGATVVAVARRYFLLCIAFFPCFWWVRLFT